MKNKKWYVVIILISFSGSIYLLTNGNGGISLYKLFILPMIISVFSIVLGIISGRLAEKDRLPHKLVLPIAMSVPVLFAISQYGKYILNQSNENYTQKIIHVLVALIIIAVGNYLPKTKPSRFVGLKFFWLLDKPVLWFKVHRLAGYLWILSGVLMLSLGVSNKWFWIVSYVMLLYVIPLIYSIVLLKKEKEKKMKSSKIKHLIISSILCLATVGIFLVFGKNLPDVVPVHWDSSGNVNGTIAKNYLTYGAPFAYLLINFIAFAKFQGSEKATWKYYLVPLSVIAISFLVIFLALR